MSEEKDNNCYESPYKIPVEKMTYNYYSRVVRGSGLEHAILLCSEELRAMGQKVEIIYGPRVWSDPTDEDFAEMDRNSKIQRHQRNLESGT